MFARSQQIIFLVFLLPSTSGVAQTMTFKDVWARINESSPLQESSRLSVQFTEAAQSRAGRHWLPKVYIDAKGYQTNDPGASFFGLLQQRKVETTDFNPDALNHPQARTYIRGALGLDLPLYEGGMKAAEVNMYGHEVSAQKMSVRQIQIEQYAQVGAIYGTLSALQRQKVKLQKLNTDVNKLLGSYQLGSKSNPVGYSGLLGMKSLANRLQSHLNQIVAVANSQYATVAEMGLGNVKWEPEIIEAENFVQRYLQTTRAQTKSYRVAVAEERVKASELAAKMERARMLPRVGAFAESFMFNGSRDTADGYSAGVYLQWNLFGPSDYGRVTEAKIKSAAAAKAFEASVQQENAEKTTLIENLGALKTNIKLLDDSDRILSEQTTVATKLFRNGSISALQMVEVLNRRTDLVLQQADAEIALIQTATQAILREPFEIPETAMAGVKNEK